MTRIILKFVIRR